MPDDRSSRQPLPSEEVEVPDPPALTPEAHPQQRRRVRSRQVSRRTVKRLVVLTLKRR